MAASTLTAFSEFLKEHYSADAVARLVNTDHPWIVAVKQHAPVTICVPVAAVVAVSALGWMLARRNELAGTEEASYGFFQALAEWFTQLVAMLFPKSEEATPIPRGLAGHPSSSTQNFTAASPRRPRVPAKHIGVADVEHST